ncbi:Hypothetical predicted protein [Pelobates cultripes]|uniref:SEA domain-containing protein n=1 Tax=Pelobates cultripes TaxID=61616 RepID=A0AAD1RJI7_PELCU|nr:Hypothetical predicted protein [Pelobates cultripes]
MNTYMKAAAITLFISLAVLAAFSEWRPKTQNQQPEFSREIHRDIGKRVNDKPSPLQKARQNENKSIRRRHYRDVIMELESSYIEKTLTTSEKNGEIVNSAQSRKKYLIIHTGKNKDIFRDISKDKRKMDVMFEGSGSGFGTTEGPLNTTIVRYTETDTSPSEGSGDMDTTPVTSKGPYATSTDSMESASQMPTSTYSQSPTTTPTPTTTTSNTETTPGLCRNGGTYDGVKCICLDQFYGPLCESVVDRVEIGDKVNTTVKVNLRITNRNYTAGLEKINSPEYNEFVDNFRSEMKRFYKDLPGYKDVIIISLSNGSVYVEYEVIVEAEYNENVSVTTQYEEIFQNVSKTMKNFINNCTSKSTAAKLCVDETNIRLDPVSPKSEKELCNEAVQAGFAEHFEPMVINSSLICVSSCSPNSKSYLKCYEGTCQLEKVTGAHCLCPKTETYIYTFRGCQGKILKAGLYGGIGAGIGVLLIIIFTVGFIMIRKNQKKHTLFKDDENSLYEDDDNDWTAQRGIINLNSQQSENTETKGFEVRRDTSTYESFRSTDEDIPVRSRIKIVRDCPDCICIWYNYGCICFCRNGVCESLVDRVEIGDKVNTTVKVNLRITNRNYTAGLEQINSPEYNEFVDNFRLEMKGFYKDLPGYKDVIIISLSPGSVYVEHEVIVEAEYNEYVSVTKQYEEIFQNVSKTLDILRNNSCTSESAGSELCVDVTNIVLSAVSPKSEKDRCNEVVQPGFQEHFEPMVINNSLSCVSRCSPNSKSYLFCNEGTCQLEKATGAHCLCPNTETYVYTSQGCQGKILMAGLYGGIGAGIAALLIIIFTVGFFMFRKKLKKHTSLRDEEISVYEDNDNEWSAQRGITNLSEAADEGLCRNGGTFTENKCICLDKFYGPLCESMVDRVEIGDKVNTTVKVNMRIINKNYTAGLEQIDSPEYNEFVENFRSEMKGFYKDLPGYKDVIIISLRNIGIWGSVYVEHEVIVEAEYNEYVSVIKQYEEMFQNVSRILDILRNNSCTSESTGCILFSIILTAVSPKSEKELCNEAVQSGFEEHFEPMVVNSSLICVSSCSPNSKSYLNCNEGTCQLEKVTGAHCLCPNTETYLYTSQGCQGKILMAGLYGGIGAGIAALLIIIFTVGFVMFRNNQKKHTLFKDEKNSVYEANDNEWSGQRSITNLSEAAYEVTEMEPCVHSSLHSDDSSTSLSQHGVCFPCF